MLSNIFYTTKTTKIFFILVFFIPMLFIGCFKNSDTATLLSDKNMRIIKDTTAKDIKVPKDIKKITSISPVVTDIIIDLGFQDNLVVVDEYAYEVEPSLATNKNIIKTDLLRPNIESIIDSGSDIVFISTINYDISHFYLLEKMGITVINVPTSSRLDEIEDSIMFIARVLDCEAVGKNIVDDMNKSLDSIMSIGQTITDKKSIYFEIEPPPNIYSFGSGVFLNDIINIIGAENIFKDKKNWIKASEEAVITLNPDIIILLTEHGTSISDGVKKRAGWDNINAIKNDRIYLTHGGFISRPTHNIIPSIKKLAKYVYPTKYPDEYTN